MSYERTKVCDDFARQHNLAITKPFEQEMEGIYWLSATRDALQVALASRSQELIAQGEPTWAMLWTMLDRVYEHAEGSIVTFLTGTWASTEIIVRAVLEAAVNVMYVLQENPPLRLLQYLTFYFDSSRKQLHRLRDLSCRLKGTEAVQARLTADRGLAAVKLREEIVTQILKAEGFSSTTALGWPQTVLDRFKALGLELDHRSIYAVLSSQTHNDADSLVDYVMFRALGNIADPAAERREVYKWLRYYVYHGLDYYLRAAEAYAAHYRLMLTGPITPAECRKQVGTTLDATSQELVGIMDGS